MTAPIGPSLDLQIAVVTALTLNTDLAGLIGNPLRLYQDVPDKAVFPYVTIGIDQNVPDLAQSLDGSEIFFDLHVWSRANGYTECKSIGAALKAAIPDAVTLSENRNLLVERRAEHHMMDPDGETKHGVYSWRALVEPAD